MNPYLNVAQPGMRLALLCVLLSGNSLGAGEQSPLTLPPGSIKAELPIAGGQLAWHRREGGGPTLVLIPGTFSDARVYGQTLRKLDPKFDIILFEHRGLGGSWPPPAESSIEQCARDVISVMEALKINSFYVGGHSLGGMISIELAREIPEHLRGVISIEGWTNAQAASIAFQSDMQSTQTAQQIELLKNYRSEVLQRWTPEQIKLFGSIWRQWDGSEILRQTKLPILELYGDRNRPPPTRDSLGLPDRPEIQLILFKGASHALLIERPDEVADKINSFIHHLEESRQDSRQ